jgi:hypothetical protein
LLVEVYPEKVTAVRLGAVNAGLTITVYDSVEMAAAGASSGRTVFALGAVRRPV